MNQRHADTVNLLADSNLSLGVITMEQANRSFFQLVSLFFLRRWHASRELHARSGPPGDPPPPEPPGDAPPFYELVHVETDEDRELILHTKGYFLNTSTTFGYSTPARRLLAHGTYMFGVYTREGPWFLDALFEVPPEHVVYLKRS